MEKVLKQTKALKEIVQEPLALIQSTDNQSNGITQHPVAQLEKVPETLTAIYHYDIGQIEEIFKRSAVIRTNWAIHVILLNTKLPFGKRYWYITQAVANGWSSNVLKAQIETNLFERQVEAKRVNNFSVRLPQPQSDLANYLMKDPYIFDLMGQTERMEERDIERQLVSHITTPANRSDIKELPPLIAKVELPKGTPVLADKGYASKENRDCLRQHGLIDGIMHKAARNRPLTESDKAFNKLISPIRSTIERTFGSIKRWFHGGRCRYRGLAKAHTQNALEGMAFNLYRTPGLIMSRGLK